MTRTWMVILLCLELAGLALFAFGHVFEALVWMAGSVTVALLLGRRMR